jgi:hypothetical protein
MKNPWLSIPEHDPFVLPEEAGLVRAHNEICRYKSKPTGLINTKLRPVPFIGNPNANVVLLTLNPGDKPGDLEGQSNDIYGKLSRRNLSHDGGYYYLNPTLPDCPGKSYAHRQFKELLADFPDRIYHGVFLAQYMPYHSNTFVNTRILFPSQKYTFGLVSQAVARGAVVVVLRARKLWLSAVPELACYANLFQCSNPLSPTLSRRSLKHSYEIVANALQHPR